MRRRSLTGLIFCLVGCGTQDSPSIVDLMPLNVGNVWVYDESGGPLPGTITKTVTDTETLDGKVSFVWQTEQTNSAVVKRSNWLDDGVRISRVRQQRFQGGLLLTSRTYELGFLRIDRSLDAIGATLSESHVRTERDGAGNVVDRLPKTYTWTVEAIDEEVSVPAGTFSCVRIKRVDANNSEEKIFWYAAGIGKVKELGPAFTVASSSYRETEALSGYDVQ